MVLMRPLEYPKAKRHFISFIRHLTHHAFLLSNQRYLPENQLLIQ